MHGSICYSLFLMIGQMGSFKQGIDQKASSWGLELLERVNLVPRYPPRCSTFLMLAKRAASTDFWTVFNSLLHLASWALPSSTCLFLISEAFLSSFLVNLLPLLKKESSTLAVTPARETEVVVAKTQAGLTRLRETPLRLWGPVTNKLPEASLLSTTTLRPRLAPESRMTTDPGWTEALPVEARGCLLARLMQAFSSSAGYQVFWLFLTLRLGAPPRVRWEVEGLADEVSPARWTGVARQQRASL